MKIHFENLKTSFGQRNIPAYLHVFRMNSLKPRNTIKALRVASALYALSRVFFKKTRIISPISPGKEIVFASIKEVFPFSG